MSSSELIANFSDGRKWYSLSLSVMTNEGLFLPYSYIIKFPKKTAKKFAYVTISSYFCSEIVIVS